MAGRNNQYKRRHDSSEKLHLSDLDLMEVIRQERLIQRDDTETVRVSVSLSSWMVTAIDVLKEKSGDASERKFTLACMNLGTALLNENFDKKAIEIRKMRDVLNWDKNPVIADLANSHSPITLGVDDLKNAMLVKLQITNWSSEDLAVLAQKIGIQISSMRRVAICYSLYTVLEELPPFIQAYIPTIKEEFVEKVDCLQDLFNRWIIAGKIKEEEKPK